MALRRGIKGYVDPDGYPVTSVTPVDLDGVPIGQTTATAIKVDARITEPDGSETTRATINAIHELNHTLHRIEALLAAMISG